MKLEATRLRGNRWAVRPEGQLGTCGSFPALWTVTYVNAPSNLAITPDTVIDRIIKETPSREGELTKDERFQKIFAS